MYSVRVHPACADEYRQLRATEPKVAADIYVVLDEVFHDPSVQEAIIQERFDSDSGLIDISRFLDMWKNGTGENVWRAKLRSDVDVQDEIVKKFETLPTLQRYRFFYTLNRETSEIWILAISKRISGKKGKGDIYAPDNELRALLNRRCRECGGDRRLGGT